MNFPTCFIRAGADFAALDHIVPAPYFVREFELKKLPEKAELIISGLGFYELWVNGKKITKGALAPYISNPDQLVYGDLYDIAPHLTEGTNVLGVCLGNGMQNCFGGYVWDFEKAKWRGAPLFALRAEIGEQVLETGEDWLTAPSPLYYDDIRNGAYYDARREIPGWNRAGCDRSGWKHAEKAPLPRGERRLCGADRISVQRELRPVRISREGDSWLYDFGINTTGVCRLQIAGRAGQQVEMRFGEVLRDGVFYARNIKFEDNDHVQKDLYLCRGGAEESWTPVFTYHGFRYCLVSGIDEAQATPELLTLLEMHSDLPERGGFSCSDETVNTLQTLTRRSTLNNFFYFPTDCPQREKNGWTGDAALSAEHTLLNLEAERSYREWMVNVCAAQHPDGNLPGIVPTDNWGYGTGPAWDCVLFNIPYSLYVLRGDLETARQCSSAFMRYLSYLTTRLTEEGLIHYGLGDWCQCGRNADDYDAPSEFTGSVIAMDLCRKAALLFDRLGMELQRNFAEDLAARLRRSVRAKYVDCKACAIVPSCQTTQAFGLFYEIFEPQERAKAFEVLVRLIGERDDHMDVGVLGARVIFRVLGDFGRADLALKMITRPDFPSYGNWIARGATTLWEAFWKEDENPASFNHHFWGDISAWFIEYLAGIRYNPAADDLHRVDFVPSVESGLTHAEAFHSTPFGRVSIAWKREGGALEVRTEVPEGMTGRLYVRGWADASGSSTCPVRTGTYRFAEQ